MIRDSLDSDVKLRSVIQLSLATSGGDEGPEGLVTEIRAHTLHAQQVLALQVALVY